jgi:hypothetical protein
MATLKIKAINSFMLTQVVSQLEQINKNGLLNKIGNVDHTENIVMVEVDAKAEEWIRAYYTKTRFHVVD